MNCYCCGVSILPGRGCGVEITRFAHPDDPPGIQTTKVRHAYCSKKCADWSLGIRLNPREGERDRQKREPRGRQIETSLDSERVEQKENESGDDKY
jgi:hypothetical protein